MRWIQLDDDRASPLRNGGLADDRVCGVSFVIEASSARSREAAYAALPYFAAFFGAVFALSSALTCSSWVAFGAHL